MQKITLKALRINAGYSTKKAAQMLQIHEQTLISWEKGKTFPTVKDVPNIEKIYGVSYDHIKFFVD